ncbi:hypothetical protein FHG87_019713, partial [Trinorchestia longiramus]
MENNINSTQEQITQISAEHNPQQIQPHTQPAGILKTIRKTNKITNTNLQNFDGNKRTTKKKTKNRKKRHVFLIGDSIIQGQKTEFKRGFDEHKILCCPKIRLPEAVHLVEDLLCKKQDIAIQHGKGKNSASDTNKPKKRTVLPTNRYHLTSPLQQTSLALQETLAKPQN